MEKALEAWQMNGPVQLQCHIRLLFLLLTGRKWSFLCKRLQGRNSKQQVAKHPSWFQTCILVEPVSKAIHPSILTAPGYTPPESRNWKATGKMSSKSNPGPYPRMQCCIPDLGFLIKVLLQSESYFTSISTLEEVTLGDNIFASLQRIHGIPEFPALWD